MNECMNIYELIQKELDEELTLEENELLEKHCSYCSACQETRLGFYRTITLLSNLPEHDPGEELVLNIMNVIEQNTTNEKHSAKAGLTGVVAGLILIFSSGMFLLGTMIISLALGSFLLVSYESTSLSFMQNITYWLNYGYNLLSILKNTFNNPYSTLAFLTLIFFSMTSFIILIILLQSRRLIKL